MSEQNDRRRLRAEGRSYGMTLKRGMNARDLDDAIQRKVAADMAKGKCSACRKAIHAGDCK